MNFDWKLEAARDVLDALPTADFESVSGWLDAIEDDPEHQSENATALFEVLERSHFYCESCARWFSKSE
jgi:hypothetical protein